MHIPTIMPWFANFKNNKVGFFGPTFALVVAGVINPLMYKSLLTASHDLNDISDGIYHTANMDNPANVPSGAYNNIIIQITNNTRQDKVQLMYSINSQAWFTRCKYSGSGWISWQKLALED